MTSLMEAGTTPDAAQTAIRPVLILGAGINGCALARELALNGIPVWVAERNDIAYGATSKSSRLIHGGLRYLEYGEFRLVRESLAERDRLLKLAPQFVVPLDLYIPASTRLTGLFGAAMRFVSGLSIPVISGIAARYSSTKQRGLWLIRLGLEFYRRFAGDPGMANTQTVTLPSEAVPAINPRQYRWVCSYRDAQIRYPERFVLALLHDARRLARENDVDLRVFTHADVRRANTVLSIRATDGVTHTLEPSVIVNATGAWGDATLDSLDVASQRLFGGTKGSHIVTHHPGLLDAIGKAGIYAEAEDGRLVFILPYAGAALVGTTDERFEGAPGDAVASDEEIDYLISMVNQVVDGVVLTRDDVTLHYSGVRPLPYRPAGSTAAISRDHQIVRQPNSPVPTFTLVGGKLTTCRAFAELAADTVLAELKCARSADSRDLPVFGAPPSQLRAEPERAGRTTRVMEQVRELVGHEAASILMADGTDDGLIDGTDLPIALVRWSIDNEWVDNLSDLVERRLMLIYQPSLSVTSLTALARCLAESGRIGEQHTESAVREQVERLRQFGYVVDGD